MSFTYPSVPSAVGEISNFVVLRSSTLFPPNLPTIFDPSQTSPFSFVLPRRKVVPNIEGRCTPETEQWWYGRRRPTLYPSSSSDNVKSTSLRTLLWFLVRVNLLYIGKKTETYPLLKFPYFTLILVFPCLVIY